MSEEKRIFGFLRIPERTRKLRTNGLTMVSGGDYWLAVAGTHWIEGL